MRIHLASPAADRSTLHRSHGVGFDEEQSGGNLGWVETEHGGDRAAVGFELWAVDFHALVDRPGIVGRDGAGDAAEQLGITSLLVSISHCHTHATAFAVAVGESE
jgi:hypothetical protein